MLSQWDNPELDSWIRSDLAPTQIICNVDIERYNGFARQYHFVVATSTTDGNIFTNVFGGGGRGGSTASFEK